MKVLFAVSNEEISESIVKKYQKEYKQIISYKNVYYFNAILKELQKDKTYDRVVISEELEAFTNTQYDQIDKFIFEKLDSISDEEILNQITKIMSDDYDITDNNKAIMDIIKIYEKNKLVNEKNEIINKLEDSKNLTQEEVASLENKLSELIIKLAKMK